MNKEVVGQEAALTGLKVVGFTPGPWTWENRSGAGLIIKGNPGVFNFVEWSTTGEGPVTLYHILETPGPVDIGYERWVRFEPEAWNKMQEANARLIAAAPDLLGALEELSNLMQDVIDGNYTPDSFTLQPSQNAISKARVQ